MAVKNCVISRETSKLMLKEHCHRRGNVTTVSKSNEIHWEPIAA